MSILQGEVGQVHVAQAIPPKHPLTLATILTVLAGFLDAAAYIELNHLYVSFMSGNSTHLGLSIPTGDLSQILGVLIVIGAFVFGAFAGTWVSDNSGPHSLILTLAAETAMLFIAVILAVMSALHPSLFVVAVAMGMQNSLHQVVAGADVGRGFITGALFSLGQSLARLKCGNGQGWRAASYFVSWLVFVIGASIGAVSLSHFGLVACLTGALAVALALLVCLWLGRL
jgi:uncharacterized membrane protein YoaK (UPF0700 family)